LKPGISHITTRIRPYLLISLAAVIAYLPVSSMLFSLKNDVLAIEYPVQHFMSEALRHGENPLWFNTWCMGFPLQSVLTWGIFSTPRVIIGAVLPSDVTVLHIEFLLFIMSAGWAMFSLLKAHFLSCRTLSLLLSCCYMLSGFTVGSSQWLLYLTGLTFIPVMINSSLHLLKKPSVRTAFFFGLAYFLLLTNVHIYLTFFTSYLLVLFFLICLIRSWSKKQTTREEKIKLVKFVSLAFIITLAFSAAPAYYTAETIAWLERSNSLEESTSFFRSNYLHPEGLKSLVWPLSTVKIFHFNTEGSIQNVYTGLLPLLLFLPSLLLNFCNRNKKAWALLFSAIFFLLLSFGHLIPLRGWLNVLPGMSYFRHPGVLRIFFILFFILYLGYSYRNLSLTDVIKPGSAIRKTIIISLMILGLLMLAVILTHLKYLPGIWKGSVQESVRTIENGQLVLLNSFLQFVFAVLLLLAVVKHSPNFKWLIMAELVCNFLCCTPFYAASSSSVKAVNNLFNYQRGFAVQHANPYSVPAEIKYPGGTTWRNINTFRKEVSANISMPGPLILKPVSDFLSSARKQTLQTKKLVFMNRMPAEGDSLQILEQKPAKVKVFIRVEKTSEVVLQQAYFPGWKVFYNGRPLPIVRDDYPFVHAFIPAGEGELLFTFEKKPALYSALFLHLLVLSGIFIFIRVKLKAISSSPSWRYG